MYSVFLMPGPFATPAAPAVPPALPGAVPGAATLLLLLPLPGRLFQLSTRDAMGLPPAVVLLIVVPRRLPFTAALLVDGGPLSARAGCFRAQDGILSSGLVPWDACASGSCVEHRQQYKE